MKKTSDILNDPELLQLRDAHMCRLQKLFDGQTDSRAFVLLGVYGHGRCDLYTEPEQWVTEALDDLASKAEGLRDTVVFRPLSINPWPYGVHFIDKLFGATVYELDGEKDNWQAEYLTRQVGGLEYPDIDNHPAVMLARCIAKTFVDANDSVPFFAPPVLSSPLNIALNLYGQEFLVAMLIEPEAARHDLRIITDTIKHLHQWFRNTIPVEQLQMVEICGRIQPPGHGQLCGCSCQLLSPEQYREFIAPLDDEILSLYPNGGLIHLCGSHSQHIPVWREMRSLRAVQLNDRATEDTHRFFSELRHDQILYINPCAAMPVEMIMEITRGKQVVIVSNITDTVTIQAV